MKFDSKKIRKDFIHFFKNKSHKIIRSSPVLPIEDPTILFTNAGMNQFKKIFLNIEKPKYKRVVNSQKCIRVSGKHNDLEEVGVDKYHHTFFEMLGNWSFGDYYKKEAIMWSWELITEVWKLDKNRLWVTVYKNDDEAEELWIKNTNIDPKRVLRFGDKDNFWEMGDTGPCGPCSEIHYYVGDNLSKQNKAGVNKEEEYRELWNLVFIEFNRTSNGKLVDLPLKHVDTGAGLERIVSTLNKQKDHYQTDLFLPIINQLAKISGKSYEFKKGVPHRVIADHLRMVSFSIADGIMPSNEGRGYVVRRILRRAARFGRVLEIKGEFLFTLLDELILILGEAYPELEEKKSHIQKVIKAEEIAFGKTLDRGLILFNDICREVKGKNISGKNVFKLYDTYGFPVDLTELLAKERSLKIDKKEFEILMLEQKKLAKSKAKFSFNNSDVKWIDFCNDKNNSFVGYKEVKTKTKIQKYRMLEDKAEIVLVNTPFYAEAGGQIGDSGIITGDKFEFKVENTYKEGNHICHYGTVSEGAISSHKETSLIAKIDEERRTNIKLNHTATHLLHQALKIVLGEHVQQAGSLVSFDRLRFDLTHYQKVTDVEIEKIENIINNIIRKNIILDTKIKSFSSAKKEGAVALFGEKYEDKVRVVNIEGFSKELCGGTHVDATGDIGIFKIISETSLASGVRRIEAVTGEEALIYINNRLNIINSLTKQINCEETQISKKIEEMSLSLKENKKKIEELNVVKLKSHLMDLNKDVSTVNGIQILSGKINIDFSPNIISDNIRVILNKKGIALIGITAHSKFYMLCSITKDICNEFNAGEIISSIAEKIGVKGGGANHMAIISFDNLKILDEALSIGIKLIKFECNRNE